MANERLFSLDEANKLFKIKYEKLSENVYNSANVLLGRVKKSYDFVGEKIQITIPSSFSGGVGSGALPKANTALYQRAELTAKKMYAVVEIDRETIKASLKDEGSFVRATKEVVQKAVESFMRNMSRALFNDGSGKLGSGNGTTVTGNGAEATPFVVTISAMKEANFEERDLVHVENSGTSQGLFEIIGVVAAVPGVSSGTVSLKLADGNVTGSPAADCDIYMQGSSSAVEWRGINGPAFDSYQTSVQTVSNATWTLVTNLGEVIDTDTAFSGSTFTVPAGGAGTYFIYGYVTIDDIQAADIVISGVVINHSTNGAEPANARRGDFGTSGTANSRISSVVNIMTTLAVGDTVRLSVYHNEGTSEQTEAAYTRFGGYRLSI